MGISELERQQIQMAQRGRASRLARGQPAVPRDPGTSLEPMSRIKILAGRSGSMGRQMRRTTVELPFTELNPSMTSQGGQALTACQHVLERIHPADRDVVLANLLAKFGHVVPG